ncbi:peroxisomal membrane anchor protein conserved region-domain-containing protein [Xylariaceae sp. FL0594]|nr:peroxisomal membrane anchor protein conserved region-domain-containing protein [Xylariaceae sp. FL0594]
MADTKQPPAPTGDETEARTADSSPEPTNVTLEHARQFLSHDSVKEATAEEKRAFLKTKGFDDAQITQLFEEMSSQTTVDSSRAPDTVEDVTTTGSDTKESSAPSNSTAGESSPPPVNFAADNAPIITYPEFLTKPQRPAPLITPSRLANIFAISGAVWALLYGTAGLVVRPMVDNLNEARSEYYTHVNEKLGELVRKLERSVSEIPYKDGKPAKSSPHHQEEDGDSVTSDPTELFHRDVGTQTSPPPSLASTTITTSNSGDKTAEKPIDAQARKLAAISASLRELTLMHTQAAERTADSRTSAVAELRDQVDKLTYANTTTYDAGFGFGYGRAAVEPDDEFKRTKDAIRSAKGIFLSSRSFPAVTTTTMR